MSAWLSAETIQTFQQSLMLMLKGMSGIFIFMLVFYGMIKLLETIFKNANNEDK